MGLWANSNLISNKYVKIMALKPNQLHVTTINPQANAIIELVHKSMVVNDMLKLFDLENNHETLEEQEDNPFDYFLFLRSTACDIKTLEAPITQYCRDCHANLFLAEI
jgi:hypothetical protein